MIVCLHPLPNASLAGGEEQQRPVCGHPEMEVPAPHRLGDMCQVGVQLPVLSLPTQLLRLRLLLAVHALEK
jgi:hypothetical protein